MSNTENVRQGGLIESLGAALGRWAGLLLGLALAAAVAAQWLLDQGKLLGQAALLYVLAACLFAALFYNRALENPAAEPVAERRRLPWILILLAVLLGALSWPRFTGNLFRLGGTLLWLGALALLGLAAWMGTKRPQGLPLRSGPPPQTPTQGGLRLTWTHLALLGVILIGAFYRLYRIDLIPLEMGCDLPHNYNNIRLILRKEFLIFFPSVPGREGLFFYLAAPFCRLFGLSHTTIKIAGSLVGLATIPVIYLLGKELFNREVGLYSAFFLAVSHWHIIMGRVGYRATTVPLVLGLMWYFLLRAMKTGQSWFWALAGFFLGLGFYTYPAFMVVPGVVALALLSAFVVGRGRRLLRSLDNILLLVIVAVVVFIPLGRFAYEQPQVYGYRAATRITSIETPLPRDIIATLGKTISKALLMFNYRGDAVFIANVPYMRELGFFTAVLFALGVTYLFWRWRRGYNLTLLIALGVMLLPTALSLAFPQEVPNAIRAIGVLPAAVLFPALALALVRERAFTLFPSHPARVLRFGLTVQGASQRELTLRWGWTGRHTVVTLLVLMALYETWAVYPTYFNEYTAHLPGRNYSITLEMARAIDEFTPNGESYIKIMPYWYDGNAVRAQLRHTDQSWGNELDALRPDAPPFVGPPAKFMVIVHPQDAEALRILREAFPRGVAVAHADHEGGVAFFTFYGER